jgi:hypothetical protein
MPDLLRLAIAIVIELAVGLPTVALIMWLIECVRIRREDRSFAEAHRRRMCFDIPNLTDEDREWLREWSFRLTDPRLLK